MSYVSMIGVFCSAQTFLELICDQADIAEFFLIEVTVITPSVMSFVVCILWG